MWTKREAAEHKKWEVTFFLAYSSWALHGNPTGVFSEKRHHSITHKSGLTSSTLCFFYFLFYFVCLFFASIIPFCLPASPPSLSVANDIRTLINISWRYLNSVQIIDAGKKNINMSPTRSTVQSPTSCVPFLLTCFLLGSPKLAK